MIPNKLAYFSHGTTYRTNRDEENINENTITFVGDDMSIATKGNIFGVRGVYPGTCTTAAGTAAKVATTTPLFPLDSNGKPLPGTTIAIKFSNTNTYKTAGTTMTLNVNSTGAYPIYYNNAEVVSTTSANTAACGYKNRYTFYIFNGTQWVWLSYGTDTNSTYSNASLGQGYAIQDNESESDTVTATLSSYALTTGGIVVVKFNFDVPCVSNPTLNVNEKGQRYIYHNGSPLGPGIIKSGDLATFIYSTNYYLISLDRDFNDPVSVGTLNTNNSTAQTASSSESFSGNINLHKVSKTGSYNDLLDKPTIPTAVTVDSTWVENSTNPVESQLIQNALTSLEDTFTDIEDSIPSNISDLTNDVGFGKVMYGQYSNGNFYPGSYNGPNGTPRFIDLPVTPNTTTTYIDISSHKSYHYNGSSYVRLDDEQQTLPTIGTLNTNNSTAQTASSSESFSGNISLHKISKTGSYNDLLNKPTIPTAVTIDSTWIENSTNPVESQLIQSALTSLENTLENNIPTNISELTDDVGFGKVVYGKYENGNFYPGSYSESSGNPQFINSPVTPNTTTTYIDIGSHKSYHYNGSSYIRLDDEQQTLPTIGTLNTNNSASQVVNSSEPFSETINLHKVSKTGSYTDLNNIPIVILDSITTIYEAISSNIGKKFFTTRSGRDNIVEIISDGFGATSATHFPSNNVIYYVIDVNKFYRYKLNSTFTNGQMVEIGSIDISGKADLNGNEEESFTANGLYVTAWTDYTKGINIDDNYNSTTQENTLEFFDGVGTLSYTFGNTSEVIATRSDLDNLSVKFIVSGTISGNTITNPTKTFTEIKAAYNSGKIVIFIDDVGYEYQCMECSNSQATFFNSDTTIGLINIFVNASNTWSYLEQAIPSASNSTPRKDGVATIGTSLLYARADHVHPRVTAGDIGAVTSTAITNLTDIL